MVLARFSRCPFGLLRHHLDVTRASFVWHHPRGSYKPGFPIVVLVCKHNCHITQKIYISQYCTIRKYYACVSCCLLISFDKMIEHYSSKHKHWMDCQRTIDPFEFFENNNNCSTLLFFTSEVTGMIASAVVVLAWKKWKSIDIWLVSEWLVLYFSKVF